MALFFAVQLARHYPLRYDPPFQTTLNISLNAGFIILGIIMAWGALKTGKVQLVWMGAGVLVLGLAIILAIDTSTLVGTDSGTQIQNIGAFLAGSLHLIGVLMAFFSMGLARPGTWRRVHTLLIGYGAGITVVLLVALMSSARLIPVFFIPGVGGTPLGRLVITMAATLFIVAALVSFSTYITRSRSSFLYFYSLGLALIGRGQLGYAFTVHSGDVMEWIGIIGEWGGSAYFLVGLILILTQSRGQWNDMPGAFDGIFSPSAEGYRLLLDASSDAVVGLDAGGLVLIWNSAAERILGYQRQEALGRSFEELSGIDVGFSGDSRSAGSDSPGLRELLIRRRDGLDVWLGISVSRSTVRGNGISIVSIQDITERKKAEQERERLLHKVQASAEELQTKTEELLHSNEELRHQREELVTLNRTLQESERRFSLIYEKAPYPIALVDRQSGTMVNVNEQWVKTFGYSRQDALGRTNVELGINRDMSQRTRILSALKEHGSVNDLELILFTKSGEERTVSSYIDGIDLAGRHYLLLTIHDVTQRRKAEEGLRES